MERSFKFSVSHTDTSEFRDDGLRPFFQYRDLGIRDATNGAIVAHVIRTKPGMQPHPERHHHEVEFQMVYVLKGWVKFHYEGVGEVTLKAGSCVHQPPGIKHTEIDHSDDLELIEIVMPADFKTVND
ncbi:MAG: cupin domain-containing protein [Betaproteobacteria bacterium]|nr:cupin domain-containing protein [Betaproteobacteria bacterium]